MDTTENPFAGIASRWGQGGGLAFHAVRAARDSLTVEGSAAANQERSVTALSNTFASLRGALAYKHVFSANAFLTQALEWITDLENTDDQRLNSETTLTAPLSRRVALKAAYVIRYDRRPEPGFETTDRYGANGMDGVGSFGWAGAYGTVYRVDPEARLVIVLMIQLIPNATDIRTAFPTAVYQALVDPAAPAPKGTGTN